MDPTLPRFVHDAEHSVFGTFDETTAWRLVPLKHGLSLFRFEDISGDTVPIPENISMIRSDASGLIPHPLTGHFAARIGQEFVLQQGVSYHLTETTLGGNARQSLLTITNKQYHEVTKWASGAMKIIRSEKLGTTQANSDGRQTSPHYVLHF